MAKGTLAILLVALAIAAVQAQNKTATAQTEFNGALTKNGFTLAAALFDIAGLTASLNKPAAVYTVLVPTDAAVTAFLKEMGLSVEDLKKRPLLAKQLAGQHLILKANVGPAELFANGPARIVATAAGEPNDLLFTKAADGGVKVADIQGNTATVSKTFAIDGKKSGHGIDKVLMPDTVFVNFADLCAFRPLTLKTFCHALAYADLNSTVNAAGFANTVFVPNNEAFTKAKVNLDGGEAPTVAKTAEILKYHVLPGYQTLGHGLPTSIKNGAKDKTLLDGQTITVDYQRVTPAADSTRKLPYAKAVIKTTSGQNVNVLRANVHVGPAVAHGVGAVLLPGSAAPAAAKPAAVKTTKPAGRHLMQFGWGMQAGATSEGDAAAGDIQNAVNGDESVAGAAQQSLVGADALSVPGAIDNMSRGVAPW